MWTPSSKGVTLTKLIHISHLWLILNNLSDKRKSINQATSQVTVSVHVCVCVSVYPWVQVVQEIPSRLFFGKLYSKLSKIQKFKVIYGETQEGLNRFNLLCWESCVKAEDKDGYWLPEWSISSLTSSCDFSCCQRKVVLWTGAWSWHVTAPRSICILAEEEAGEEKICIREVIIYTSTCSSITMETSISSRRPDSFSFSFFFLLLLSGFHRGLCAWQARDVKWGISF